MFNPSREEVRDFFFETWRKYRAGEPLAGLETVALKIAERGRGLSVKK